MSTDDGATSRWIGWPPSGGSWGRPRPQGRGFLFGMTQRPLHVMQGAVATLEGATAGAGHYLFIQGGGLSQPKGNPMKAQKKTKARIALDLLDQAWAYYTPEKRIESRGPVNEDLPLAA